MQSSNKEKEDEQGSAADKGKKPMGGGRGKTKVIATGHKASQKSNWLKRGGGVTEEGYQDVKKLRSGGIKEMEVEAGQMMGGVKVGTGMMKLKDGNTNEAAEDTPQDEENSIQKAGPGAGQPRLGK